MITVGICDDDATARADIRKLCELQAYREDVEVRFLEFSCAESLLIDYPDSLDIVFLDVIMGEMSGVEASHEVRRHDTNVMLVFMSNYAQYALDGYAVRAYRYLLKPVNPYQFGIEMEGVFHSLDEEKEARFVVRNDEGLFAIIPKDTRYIETMGGKNIRFKILDSEVTCRGTLKQWEGKLASHGFFRCHNAVLVNLAFIESVLANGTVVLLNGEKLPVSRHRRKDLMESLSAFVRGRI